MLTSGKKFKSTDGNYKGKHMFGIFIFSLCLVVVALILLIVLDSL